MILLNVPGPGWKTFVWNSENLLQDPENYKMPGASTSPSAYKVVTNYDSMFSDLPQYPSHSYVPVANGLRGRSGPIDKGPLLTGKALVRSKNLAALALTLNFFKTLRS